jgi:hypothetical protein
MVAEVASRETEKRGVLGFIGWPRFLTHWAAFLQMDEMAPAPPYEAAVRFMLTDRYWRFCAFPKCQTNPALNSITEYRRLVRTVSGFRASPKPPDA